MTFKDFYFNIEDKLEQEDEENKNKETKTKTKTNFTSKTSNKKIADDSSIVIHSVKGKSGRRKTAKFEAMQPNDDNRVVNVMRKNSKSGSLRLNLKVNDN